MVQQSPKSLSNEPSVPMSCVAKGYHERQTGGCCDCLQNSLGFSQPGASLFKDFARLNSN